MSTMSSFLPYNHQYIILQGCKGCPRCLRSFHTTISTLFYKGVRDAHDVFVHSIQPSIHYFTRDIRVVHEAFVRFIQQSMSLDPIFYYYIFAFGFPTFRFWAYLMKVIQKRCSMGVLLKVHMVQQTELPVASNVADMGVHSIGVVRL